MINTESGVFMKVKKSLSNGSYDFVARLPIQKYTFDWIYAFNQVFNHIELKYVEDLSGLKRHATQN
jgi:hypothetical protein